MKKIILFALVAVTSLANSIAQSVFTDDNKVANGGYDVVNYFKTNTAAKGSADYTVEHDGAVYQFKDASNQEAFKNSPEKYLPEFGGYCAFAVSTSLFVRPFYPKETKNKKIHGRKQKIII